MHLLFERQKRVNLDRDEFAARLDDDLSLQRAETNQNALAADISAGCEKDGAKKWTKYEDEFEDVDIEKYDSQRIRAQSTTRIDNKKVPYFDASLNRKSVHSTSSTSPCDLAKNCCTRSTFSSASALRRRINSPGVDSSS